MSTREYLDALTVDQLRYAREYIDERIKRAEASPKRVVWQVSNGILIEENYREDEFEKAADHLLRIYKAVFMKEAGRFLVDKSYTPRMFADEVPSIAPLYVSEVEYVTEWFPVSPGANR